MFRNIVFTAFEKPLDMTDKVHYAYWGKEICPTTQRTHYQGMIQLLGVNTLDQIKSIIGNNAHIEPMKGTPEQSLLYCSKDANKEGYEFYEYGTMRKQGERTDIEDAKALLKANVDLDTFIDTNTVMWHKYGRTLERIYDIHHKPLPRTNIPKIEWHWGNAIPNDILARYNDATDYTIVEDKGWWDGYTGQKTVWWFILDDWDSKLYEHLNNNLPWKVKRRNKQPIHFNSENIIIVSEEPPCVYMDDDNRRTGVQEYKHTNKQQHIERGGWDDDEVFACGCTPEYNCMDHEDAECC